MVGRCNAQHTRPGAAQPSHLTPHEPLRQIQCDLLSTFPSLATTGQLQSNSHRTGDAVRPSAPSTRATSRSSQIAASLSGTRPPHRNRTGTSSDLVLTFHFGGEERASHRPPKEALTNYIRKPEHFLQPGVWNRCTPGSPARASGRGRGYHRGPMVLASLSWHWTVLVVIAVLALLVRLNLTKR